MTTSTTTTLALGPQNYVNNYTYDSNGNMLQDERFKYEYNGMNMLKIVKNASTDAVVEQYWYGPDGQRIKKVSFLEDGKNRTTLYVNPSYEININETGTRQDTRYVFANGERMAELHQNGSKTYYLNDHLGSSSVLVNEQGQQIDRLTYYPYGEVKDGGSGSKYGYNNKELDSTGLNYYGARYYNSKLKRWTQPDNIIQNVYDPQTLNRYSYVRNNPIIYSDPTGHFLQALAVVALVVVVSVAVYHFTHEEKTPEGYYAAYQIGAVSAGVGAISAAGALAIGETLTVAESVGGFMGLVTGNILKKSYEGEAYDESDAFWDVTTAGVSTYGGGIIKANFAITGKNIYQQLGPVKDTMFKMISRGKTLTLRITTNSGTRYVRVDSKNVDSVILKLYELGTEACITIVSEDSDDSELPTPNNINSSPSSSTSGSPSTSSPSTADNDGSNDDIYHPWYLGGCKGKGCTN
ncbi:MAG: RHS repeat-associated core domain-containing protein [Candidatus Altiarchaeota archaeon]